MNLEKTVSAEIRWTLQRIKKLNLLTPSNEHVYFGLQIGTEVPPVESQRLILRKLVEWKALNIRGEKFEPQYEKIDSMMLKMIKDIGVKPVGYFLEVLLPKFNDLFTEYETIEDGKNKTDLLAISKTDLEKGYYISMKDREIWVNDKYILSKPHGAGSNADFFDHLLKNSNKMIGRATLPEGIKKDIARKQFSKILNSLGFKGQVLKLFFPKRSKTTLLFNKQVSRHEIMERGVEETILLKELELAHSKNSSK